MDADLEKLAKDIRATPLTDLAFGRILGEGMTINLQSRWLWPGQIRLDQREIEAVVRN